MFAPRVPTDRLGVDSGIANMNRGCVRGWGGTVHKAPWGSLAVALAGVSVLVTAAAPAAPEPPGGHHYLIDAATGDATDTATGEALAPATAESLLAENVARGGPAGATEMISAQTGAVTQESVLLANPAGSCLSLLHYFTILRGVAHVRVC